LLFEAIGAHAQGGWQPLWSRSGQDGGGMISGSLGAFLVLESRKHASERGARIYARIDAIEGDRGSRDDGKMEKRMERLLAPAKDSAATVVFSGASGFDDVTRREKNILEKILPQAAIRGFGGVTGHGLEAQFPLGLALAALTLESGAKVPTFDAAVEKPMGEAASEAVVTTVGHVRGEGVAVLSRDV
ncbi:3-oxoacyl-ACP synthase, partial [Rhizobium nepotum 39/7]